MKETSVKYPFLTEEVKIYEQENNKRKRSVSWQQKHV